MDKKNNFYIDKLRMKNNNCLYTCDSGRKQKRENKISGWIKLQRRMGPGPKPLDRESQPCRPAAGAAPFIVCSNCSELLQIPEQIMQIGKHQYKLRCGSSSKSSEISQKYVIIEFIGTCIVDGLEDSADDITVNVDELADAGHWFDLHHVYTQ
ncbi:hypothetical protein KSP40_PGU003863 [Platanthera guangdongensis]|uniref:Probable zinc-ribbon domain-containing protein n=1 Tax=Platanthera guangdongensis TaxID=2320717 RepID=A0ABR2N1X7_9ASPA